MKVITIHNPWAYWISLGIKKIETRIHNKFKNLINQRIAIHASKAFDTQALSLAENFVSAEYLKFDEHIESMHYGAIVCTAFVADHRLLTTDDSREACFHCRDNQYYGLILESVKMLEKPYFCKGYQGQWNIDANLLH